MLNLAFVVGARPNFVKIAPLFRALERYPKVRTTLIHTGQHYDSKMSDVFFEELEVRKPDLYLEVGSGKHGAQTARILERLEAALGSAPRTSPAVDRIVVVGDVNSTMAAALVAAKMGIPITHVEAGLRSFDRSMPEEINRIVTDALSDMLLISEPAGMENLLREGHAADQLHLVGNVMIDTLVKCLPRAASRDTQRVVGVESGKYGIVTIHRPSNTDAPAVLEELIDVLIDLAKTMPIVFPIHPRTRSRLEEFGLQSRVLSAPGIIDLPPMGYLDFLALTSRARWIVTDSGGLQEEATFLGIPCLTMRENTERPITVEQGTSTLIGNDMGRLRECMSDVLEGAYKKGQCPALWDGHAADRIVELLVQ